jgi:uncharacterized protein (TIGR04255 family)
MLNLSFPNKLGTLSVNIAQGKDQKGFDGIAIQTQITSNAIKPDMDFIKNWLNDAHELCSTSFKQMTDGKLYEKFNQK